MSRYADTVLTRATGSPAGALAQLDDLITRLHRTDRTDHQEDQ